MKRLLVFGMALMLSAVAFSQKDVTKFLGIPVDGSKSAMIQKLKAKGFESSVYKSDILEGEFNGAEVNVFIQTNTDPRAGAADPQPCQRFLRPCPARFPERQRAVSPLRLRRTFLALRLECPSTSI